MKVLFVSDTQLDNPLISGYYERVKNCIDITVSVDDFWTLDKSANFDIVHLQWPEQLFGWNDASLDDVAKVESQLKFWKMQGSKIVITRHNVFPHNLNEIYKDIYKVIFALVDVVIHFSYASVDNFFEIYGDNFRRKDLLHKVIYHPMYEDVSNECSKEEARSHLNLNGKTKVVLVFGTIRHDKERKFIKAVFDKLDVEKKYLLVPRFYSQAPSKKQLFKWSFFMLSRALEKLLGNRFLGYRFIKDEDIQLYMNAADVVFVPRFEVLNSGVAVLAYSFNKVVVGPSVGSIGELLDRTNNPTFEVGNIDQAAKKIEEAISLSKKCVKNLAFAKEYMSFNVFISQSLGVYRDLL